MLASSADDGLNTVPVSKLGDTMVGADTAGKPFRLHCVKELLCLKASGSTEILDPVIMFLVTLLVMITKRRGP